MASELLASISKDEMERARFRSRRMYQMDMEHNLAVTLNEGKEIKALEIAAKLLKRNRPIDEIVEDTGLSRMEIEKLRD